MKQGFVKVAAASCAVAVADVRENTRVILETIHKMEDEGAKVMVLPELALTGYTCSDLFWQSQMIDAAKEGLKEIADGTKGTDALIFVGLPWEQGGKLFNVAAVLCHGELLGVVPKKYLPNYYESALPVCGDAAPQSCCRALRGSLDPESAECGACPGRCDGDRQSFRE